MRSVGLYICIVAISWQLAASTYSCPRGFASYGDWCYYMSNTRYDFETARQVCKNMQGDLLAFNDPEEKAFLEKLVIQKNFDTWIGLKQKDESNSSYYVWTDESSPGPSDPTLENWNCPELPEQPCGDQTSFGPCGFMLGSNGKWKNNPCENKKIFACRRPYTVADHCDLANGWHQYAQKCYKTFTDLKNWDDARETCADEASDLVMLKTAAEMEAFMHMQFCYDYQSAVWIGLSDKETANENEVQWVDGTALTESNWAPEQPKYSYSKGKNCAASYTIENFQWQIANCANEENRFMCQKDYGTCAEGWHEYPDTGHCYLMVTDEADKCTWFEAQDKCRAMGDQADLMTVSNANEQAALTDMATQLKNAGVTVVRIGISDQTKDGDYRWSSGQDMEYTNWNDSLHEKVAERVDCGYVPTTDSNPEARWGTDYCFDLESFICRIPNFNHPKSNPKQVMRQRSQPDVYADTCPDGWELNLGKCYFFSDQTLTYDDMKSYCKSTFGDHVYMVKVEWPDEQSFLSHRLAGNTWLGLVYQNPNWVWDDTTDTPDFQNWAAGGKNEQETKNCAMLQENPVGQWYNAHCSEEKHLGICEQEAIPSTDPPTTETPNATNPWDPECGPNWSYDVHNGRCYAIRAGYLANWDTATTKCEEEGASLVAITSESEQFFINSMLTSFVGGAATYWIGLNEKDTAKGWQWSDGSAVPYFNWNDGEPNNAGGQENCVNLSPGSNYKWNDHACTWEADGYICEKPGASEVTPAPSTTLAPAIECGNDPLVSGTMYIADQAFTARTEKEGREAYMARLNSASSYQPTESDTSQYIDLEFPYERGIENVTMAGAKDVSEYVTKYRIAYETAPGAFYQYVFNEEGAIYDFTGCDESTKNDGKTVALPHRIYATRVRIYPREWTGAISMRVELHGCPIAESKCEAEASVSGAVRVLDSGMTANTWEEGCEPYKARMDLTGWEALNPTSGDYLQLEFQTRMRLFEIQTKGRKDEDKWVKTFQLYYYDPENPKNDSWITYEEPHGTPKTFTANTNKDDLVSNPLMGEIAATKVRIIPLEYNGGKAMRVEITACSPGCYPNHVISGETYAIPDSQLSSSTNWDGNHGPTRSRLYTEQDEYGAGAWCALVNDENQWIKADLGQILQVRGVSTQGRSDYDQWVKKYTIQYSDTDEIWHEFKQGNDNETKVFTTSWSRNTVRTNYFEPPFKARYVRLHPTTWNQHISLRWDILACPGHYSYAEVGCYSDNPEDRDLPYAAIVGPEGGLTHELCVTHCYTSGYLYAGTQYGNECYCGNDYGSYGLSNVCDHACAGNPYQTCGGHWCNTVLSTGMSPTDLRCADGYEEFNGACFKVVRYTDDPFEWGEARYLCHQDGGGSDLASIANKAENDYIMSKVAEIGQNVWIGLHAQSGETSWEWANYEPVTYTNWDRREPNNAGDEDCAIMYHSGENAGFWNDALCSEKTHGGYVCRKSKESLDPEPTPTPDYGCGQSWLPFRWKCYHFVTSIQSWDYHRTNCEAMAEGATLARIEDSSEQAFIASSTFGSDGIFWTDLNSRDNPGTYVYTDGSQPSFTYWAPDQPNQITEGVCVGLVPKDSGYWLDITCTEPYYAVCEKASTTVTQPPSTVGGATGDCADGWHENGDYCYLVRVEASNMRLNWDSARSWCLDHNADLASIHNDQENTFIRGILDPTQNINYWIGLSRATHNETFKWSDGSESEYFNWREGEPSTEEEANCAHFENDIGYWEAMGCSNTKSYICKILRGQDVNIPSTEPYPTPDPNGDCSPDGDRWLFYNEKCYFFSDTEEETKQTWYDAEAWCNQHGGNLASIHTEDEMRFIEGQTRFIGFQWTWIGLNSIDGMESWSDGTPVEWTNWADGEPNDSGGTEMCVATETMRDTHGPWAHLHCSKEHVYICKKTPGGGTITPQVPTPAPGNCPEGYLAFLDKCYKFVDNEELEWQDAFDKCYAENKPSSLASIHNIQENAFLTAHLLERPHLYWIGMKQISSGEFAWIDNSAVTYTAWAAGEPNGGSEEKCVHLYNDMQRAGLWNDVHCSSPMRYICMTYKDEAYPAPEQPEPGICSSYGMNAPYDYMEYNGDCFNVASGTLRTWEEGEAHCDSDAPGRGHLGSIRNIYEQAFMFSIFYDYHANEMNPDDNVWIGLTDIQDPGQFAWTDTSSVTYTNWGDNQPDRPEGGCVYFRYTDSTWVDAECTEKYKSICRINEQPIPVTQPPHAENGTCPGTDIKDHNWLGYGSSCYLFMEDAVSFAEAHTFCLQLNSELVSIHSQEENDFVMAHLPSGAGYRFWTGMIRTVTHGFAWTDGSKVSYTNWYEGEPSDKNGTSENNVEMYSYDGKWNDISETQSNGFVCMTPSQITVSTTTPQPDPEPTETIPTHSTLSTMGPSTTTTSGSQAPSTTSYNGQGAGNKEREPLDPGAIVGIVFAVCALIFASLIVALVVYKRRQVNQDGLANPLYEDTSRA